MRRKILSNTGNNGQRTSEREVETQPDAARRLISTETLSRQEALNLGDNSGLTRELNRPASESHGLWLKLLSIRGVEWSQMVDLTLARGLMAVTRPAIIRTLTAAVEMAKQAAKNRLKRGYV